MFLSENIKVRSKDWIEGLVGQSQREGVGCVGARVLKTNNTIYHAGLILSNSEKVSIHSFSNMDNEASGYFGYLKATNNFSAVSSDCLMIKTSLFKVLDGFDEELSLNYSEIDLCLKSIAQGYRNVCLPQVELEYTLYDSEQKVTVEIEGDLKIFRARWETIIENDPCYNPNLTQKGSDFSLNLV